MQPSNRCGKRGYEKCVYGVIQLKNEVMRYSFGVSFSCSEMLLGFVARRVEVLCVAWGVFAWSGRHAA